MPTKTIPIDVAARTVDRDTAVPLLTDAPFQTSGVLEPGIHVHWALPDALVKAEGHQSHPPRFRGVPDLWLVVRFNPVEGDGPRTHRQWVVDSIAETVIPLHKWQPPNRAQDRIHTAPGVLKRVAAGRGEWPSDAGEFNQLDTAYYPGCRRRLGFHDDLADLGPSPNGTVSYAVIGWYSRTVFDPYHKVAPRPRDKLGHRPKRKGYTEISTAIATGSAAVEPVWNPAVAITEATDPSADETTMLIMTAGHNGEVFRESQMGVQALASALGSAPHEVVDALLPGVQNTLTVLHGSVIDVPVRPAKLLGFTSLKTDGVVLYPNLQRAMAEVAARTGAEIGTDYLDMMLGRLGQQSGTVDGVIDLPGAQHARTFQGVPGQSKWHARLDIYPRFTFPELTFALADLGSIGELPMTGNWPGVAARSAAANALMMATMDSSVSALPSSVLDDVPAATPTGPSDDEIADWIQKLREAFGAAQSGAAHPIHPRLVRVQDHRRDAAPTALGRPTDGQGTNQAGFWLDLGDPAAPIDIDNIPEHQLLAELYRSVAGARIHLPDPAHLFEVPGARWYRPWAPHLVLYGAKRQFRHNADGRFRADGHLSTRYAGELMVGVRIGGHTVVGAELLAEKAAFGVDGLPAVVAGLIAEHALTDAANAPIMARVAHRTGGRGRAPSTAQLTAATRAFALNRGVVNAEQAAAIAAIEPIGTPGSAVGLQVWRDWYGPLFLDTEATHRRKRFNDAWALPPEHIETVDRDPVIAPDREQVVTERQVATVTVANVLRDTLVGETGNDPQGNVIKKMPSPQGVDAGTFAALDVVSASLTGLDDALAAVGQREQGGFVHMNRIRVYDSFGTPAGWSSANAELEPLPAWATAVPARLSGWGRLHLRLQSASDPSTEATPFDSPVCGFLLPDFVDQALEVYDADGRPVGQVSATDPVDNPTGPVSLGVEFTPLPWASGITDPTLQRLVDALVAQPLQVQNPGPGWYETGFTAMLRVFDTLRSTLDPAFKHADGRVRLLGEPIVVLRARLLFEASDAPVEELRSGPPLLTDPGLPVLRVRVGDVTRPDDGVLGCLLTGATPAEDRFAPPSPQAVAEAVINQMTTGLGGQKTRPITHPFVAGQVSEFDVSANEPLDLVVLADARGSLYATCGMLPRKNIVMPKDLIEPALKRLRPTFRVGPILGFSRAEAVVPVMPAPYIEGMRAVFMHDGDTTFPESPIAATMSVGELPPDRVRLTEGWARMDPVES